MQGGGTEMDLEHTAIERIQKASEISIEKFQQPLMIRISGGKDSTVLTELAIRSGCPVEFGHSHTTADAPETVRFVRSEFKRLEELGYKCGKNLPVYKGKRTSMWNLIPLKLMPPTRQRRYCCEILKENGGAGRFIATGVRWGESKAREKSRGIYEKPSSHREQRIILTDDNDDTRQLFEHCRQKGKRIVNPIIDWEDKDIWDFINQEKCCSNPLYAEGCKRVGCIGCPLATRKNRIAEFERWPAYRNLYIKAFDRMLAAREARGKMGPDWRMGFRGVDVFDWWMEEKFLPGQVSLFEDEDNEDT